MKIGLALGGGGARGMAHIGVLHVLEEARIDIDIITGTSFGAIIGAIYACNPDTKATKKRLRKFINSIEFKMTNIELATSPFGSKGMAYNSMPTTKKGVISDKHLLADINLLIDDVDIKDTKITFGCVGVSLIDGKEEVFVSGQMRKAVAASCAIPGIFAPIEIDGKEYIDGGWVDKCPVVPAFDLGAEFVIAVDVSREMEDYIYMNNGLEIVLRANAITRTALNQIQLKKADIIISPLIEQMDLFDFTKADICIKNGIEATRQLIDKIKEKINKQINKRKR